MGVPSSDGEQPQPTPAQQVGNALQDNIKQGGAVGGMLGAGLLQLLAPLWDLMIMHVWDYQNSVL